MQNELFFDRLTGEEFEHYLLRVFENLGYNCSLTPSSGDYGADLKVSNDIETIVVQAKRYSRPVGVKAVQEVNTAKDYYSADKCIVVTNNHFTPRAIKLARANRVELWDRDELIQKIILSLGTGLTSDEEKTDNTLPSPSPSPYKTFKQNLSPAILVALLCHTVGFAFIGYLGSNILRNPNERWQLFIIFLVLWILSKVNKHLLPNNKKKKKKRTGLWS